MIPLGRFHAHTHKPVRAGIEDLSGEILFDIIYSPDIVIDLTVTGVFCFVIIVVNALQQPERTASAESSARRSFTASAKLPKK